MTGSANTVSSTQAKRSARTATASTTFRRGGELAAGRPEVPDAGPRRARRSRPAPRASSSAEEPPAAGGGAHAPAPTPVGDSSSAVSSASFATKPDSGGSPATSSAQAMKARPSSASDTGNARPTSGASSSSRLVSSPGSTSTSGSGAATVGRRCARPARRGETARSPPAWRSAGRRAPPTSRRRPRCPIAARSVPDDTMIEKPAMRPRCSGGHEAERAEGDGREPAVEEDRLRRSAPRRRRPRRRAGSTGAAARRCRPWS